MSIRAFMKRSCLASIGGLLLAVPLCAMDATNQSVALTPNKKRAVTREDEPTVMAAAASTPQAKRRASDDSLFRSPTPILSESPSDTSLAMFFQLPATSVPERGVRAAVLEGDQEKFKRQLNVMALLKPDACLEMLTFSIRTLKSAIERNKSDALQIADLEQRISQLQEGLVAAQTVEADLIQAPSKTVEIEQQLAALKAENERLKQEAVSMRAAHEDLARSHDMLFMERQQRTARDIRSSQPPPAQPSAQRSAEDEQEPAVKIDNDRIRQENDRLSKEIQTLSEAYEDLIEQKKQLAEQLNQVVEEKKELAEQLAQKRKRVDAGNKGATTRYGNLQKQVEDLSTQLEQSRSQNEALRSQLATVTHEREVQVASLRAEITTLQGILQLRSGPMNPDTQSIQLIPRAQSPVKQEPSAQK